METVIRTACAGVSLSWLCLAGEAGASIAPQDASRTLPFLEQAVGQYPRDILLCERAGLHRRLSILLGRRLPFFRGNMWNTGAVSRNGQWIYVIGTRLPLTGGDGAVFVADIERDTIWVWVMVSGRLFEYRERPAHPDLPAEVVLFLDNWRATVRSAGALR